jgi:hypothetical protein
MISAKAERFYLIQKLIDRSKTFLFYPVIISAKAECFYLIKKLIDRNKTWSKIYLCQSRRLCYTVRPKARGLSQHSRPFGLRKESDPAGHYFVGDGRSITPALTDNTTCPRLGLIYY